MKKLLGVVLVLGMVSTAFVACERKGGTQAGTGTDAAGTTGTAAGGDVITVGFAQAKSDESDWRMANTRSMQEAFNVPGWRMILADSNNDAAKQISDVQGFINMDVDYIVIAAVNMDGWDTVLGNARDAGIPVILVDREVNAPENLYMTWVGSNTLQEGVQATNWMETEWPHRENNPAGIVHLQGQLGSSAQVGRSRALIEAVDRIPNWSILAQQTGNWSTDVAKQIMATWIQQFGNQIHLVYAENDNMADGAIQALQEAGMSVGGADGVQIIAFDANRWALDMTLAGLINVNVECNPLHGPRVFQIIDNHRNGIMPESRIYVEEQAFFWNTITQEIIDARQY